MVRVGRKRKWTIEPMGNIECTERKVYRSKRSMAPVSSVAVFSKRTEKWIDIQNLIVVLGIQFLAFCFPESRRPKSFSQIPPPKNFFRNPLLPKCFWIPLPQNLFPNLAAPKLVYQILTSKKCFWIPPPQIFFRTIIVWTNWNFASVWKNGNP